MSTIDLNADVGEGFASDAELIPLVTSANIGCGVHSGDESSVRAAVRSAIETGVTIGAHPGHDDRESFGRREIELPPEETTRLVASQIEWLKSITSELGGEVRYVKLHGALYHQAGRDAATAKAVAESLLKIDSPLALLGQKGTKLEAAADAADIPYYGEAFADRAYQADGALTPRSVSGSLLTLEEQVVQQAVALSVRGQASTLEGGSVTVRCDSLCLHGDGPRVVQRARAMRRALQDAGVELAAFA